MTLSEGSGTRRGDAAREAPPARTSATVLQLAKIPQAWGLQQHGATTTPQRGSSSSLQNCQQPKRAGWGKPSARLCLETPPLALLGSQLADLGAPSPAVPPHHVPTHLCPQRCLHGAGGLGQNNHTLTCPSHGSDTATLGVLIAGSGPPSWVPIMHPHPCAWLCAATSPVPAPCRREPGLAPSKGAFDSTQTFFFFFPSGSSSSFIASAGQAELSLPEPHSSV